MLDIVHTYIRLKHGNKMKLLLLHGFHSLQVQWRHSLDSLVSVTMTLNTE